MKIVLIIYFKRGVGDIHLFSSPPNFSIIITLSIFEIFLFAHISIFLFYNSAIQLGQAHTYCVGKYDCTSTMIHTYTLCLNVCIYSVYARVHIKKYTRKLGKQVICSAPLVIDTIAIISSESAPQNIAIIAFVVVSCAALALSCK